jgi:hypothetical protein
VHETIIYNNHYRIVSLFLISLLAVSLYQVLLTEIKNFSFYQARLPLNAFIEHNKTRMVSSSSYAETLAASMRLAFPTPPEPSLGTPNLIVFNDLLQYLCKCAQTHKSPISKKMNLLFDPALYEHYSGGKVYPNADYPFHPEVADVPNYSGYTNTKDCANVKVTQGMALKQCNDIINMNTALIDTFLNLVPIAFK